MSDDVIKKLRALKWKGKEYPAARLGLRIRHDIAQHKYPGKDGAKLEATGRAPLELSATIPFRTGIEPGPKERWSQPLYPDAFREFLVQCGERTTGTLAHPELGDITCKLESAELEWEPTNRDGVDVRVTWVESVEDEDTFSTSLTKVSPAVALDYEAANADAQLTAAIAALQAKNATVEAATRDELEGFRDGRMDPYTFGDFARALKSPIDQANLSSQKFAGAVDAIAYRAAELSDSLERAGSPAVMWPLQDAADRLGDAAIDAKNALSAQGKPVIATYTTTKEMTLDDVARIVGADFSEVLKLNGKLVAFPSVPANTVVRYPG